MKGLFSSLYSAAGLVLLALLAARLTFIQQIGLELTPDEAYYWDWSRTLAWGYYSKPPLVAWLIHIFTLKLGHTEYGVRVPAALSHTFYLTLVYYLGQRLFDRRVGLWAALAAAAGPLSAVYGFVMTIDPPLFALWAAALCFAWQASETQKTSDFLKLGLTLGLGLLTKQTMVAFPVLYLLWLWWTPEKRPLLRSPKPYLAFFTAFLLFLPNLWWNATHGWITFRHTEEHFQRQGIFLSGPIKFLLEQAGVITPVIFFLLLYVFAVFVSRPKLRQNPKLSFLFAFSAVPLALVLPLSLLRQVNANWPHPFYAAGFILLSALILRGNWPATKGALLRKVFLLGVLLGMFVMVAVYQLPRTPEKFPPKVQRLLYKFSGWKDLARWVAFHRKKNEILITTRRDYAAEMAFYLPGKPRPYTFWEGYPRSQYDIWDGLPQRIGEDALLLLKRTAQAARYGVCFEKMEYLGKWERNIYGKTRRILLYRGQKLKICPYLGPGNG
ncbi:MAG: glycosyltransferase family 39 protein [Thermodesulfobacteria bacterium]|nr:glycosyltransferase family 39 protein [Thermodesulfobacteriota bacterium]